MHSKSRERFLTIDGRRVIFNPTAVIDRLASKNILHEAIPEHQKGFVAVAGDTAMAEIILLKDDFSWDDIPHTSHPERVMTRWTYAIGTRAVAQWACNAASRMAMDLMEKAPSGSWKHLLESHFSKPFSASFE